MSSDTVNTRRRVKLYTLNEGRTWDDNGTGHVTIKMTECPKFMSLVVNSENDGSVLLSSTVQLFTAYQKQQETLIVWSEGDNCDYALSFQEKKGCDEVWEKICLFQGKNPSVDITQEIADQSLDDDEVDSDAGVITFKLPPCELDQIDEISSVIVSYIATPAKRERLALSIESEDYIKKLVELFQVCEDAENTDALHRLYPIFKSIFLLNKTSLFEVLFSEELVMSIIGALEYDPALTQPVDYRNYLNSETRLKEVIPLNNVALVQKIHQTYRMQYVMDVVLPTPPQSAIDDSALSTLTSFIFFNKMEIVTMIQEDDKFLKNLFKKLIDEDSTEPQRRDLTLFLKEFCTFSQTLTQQSKDQFFKTLSNLGILEAIEYLLGSDDAQIKSAAIDIFCYVVEFSPVTVREFMVREGRLQDDDDQLINLVLQQMTSDMDHEMSQAMQLQGTIQILVDTETMPLNTKTSKSEILSTFYRNCVHTLTAPLFAHTANNKLSRDDYQTAHLLSVIIELLTFCIEHHAHHVKTYIASKNLLQRVLVLLRSKHMFLVLAALRLLRKCIGLKDEFYYRHIVRLDLFRPVVEVFAATKHKYNLLNSALIELFEFIRVVILLLSSFLPHAMSPRCLTFICPIVEEEEIKTLMSYLVEKYFKTFEEITYVQTFKGLKQRYDQQQERAVLMNSVHTLLSKRDSWREEDEDEDVWFEDEDEDFVGGSGDSLASTHCLSPASTKLSLDCDQISQYLDRDKTHASRSGATSPNSGMQTSPPSSAGGAAHRGSSQKSGSSDASPLRSSPGLDSDSNSSDSESRTTDNGSLSDGELSPTSVSSSSSSVDSMKMSATDVIIQNNKIQLHGLVDYPDEDSDDDNVNAADEDVGKTDSQPPVKKLRVSL